MISEALNKVKIKKIDKFDLIFLLLLLIFALAKPYQLGVFFDEGTFVYRAWRIIEGDVLYKDVLDMRPPGHYLFFFVPIMLVFKLFGFSPVTTLIGLRIALTILEILALCFLYNILTEIIKLDKKSSLILISTILFSPLFLGWGTYLITENLFILPFFAGLYYYLRRKFTLAGALLTCAIVIRHTIAILLLPIFLDLIFAKRDIKKIKQFLLGSAVPLGVVMLYILTTGIFYDFIHQMLRGLLYNKQWFNPPSISFKYDHYLEKPLKLDPAIDFLLILGILPVMQKLRSSDSAKLIYIIYLFGLAYWLSMFLFASYNTKYILPLVFVSLISAGSFLFCVNSIIRKTLLAIIAVLIVVQAFFVISSNYLKDPAHGDNYISPYLSEQVLMGEKVREYNISDKEWFISHQIITSFFAQVDSYNHLNIESDYAFPPKEKLLPLFRNIKMVMLDPATKFHMKSKPWVNDSTSNLILKIKFKITEKEDSKNDGFDIYLKDLKTDDIIVIRYHANEMFAENSIQVGKNIVIIQKFVDENRWTEQSIQISKLWLEYYNYIPKRVYISLVCNADESNLKVELDNIEISDEITGFILYKEDFEPIGGFLNMGISNGYYKFRIGKVGNGALSYLNLNYIEAEKIPIRQHQNTERIVYVPILLNKKFYPDLHKQDIIKRTSIKKV